MKHSSHEELSLRKTALLETIDRLRPQLEELSLRIHAHPETAFQERQAATWLSEPLQAAGFSVERGTAGLETAFIGRYRAGDGPTIALIAEYDALPGIGHACGHNIIGTSAVGAAIALKQACPDLPGTIMVAGAPAEETGGGKEYLVEAGIFKDVAAALMVHPYSRTVIAGPGISREQILVEYHGKAAHASTRPHEGVNALDAIVLAYVSISALRQQIRPDGRIHGIITNGGSIANTIPDYTSALFYVRAKDDVYLDQLIKRVLGCFRAAAEATGSRFEYRFTEKRYRAIRNNPTLGALFEQNLGLLGVKAEPPDPNQFFASSDIGNVSQVVPTLQPSLAIAPAGTPGHSIEFAKCAASAEGMNGMVNAAKCMALTVADLLLQPGVLERAAQEFADGVDMK